MDTAVKAQVTLTLSISVYKKSAHYQRLYTRSHTAETFLTTHLYKDHVHFILNLKDQTKCAADLICSFMDANAVRLRMIQPHRPKDVLQDPLFSIMKVGRKYVLGILLLCSIMSQNFFLRSYDFLSIFKFNFLARSINLFKNSKYNRNDMN